MGAPSQAREPARGRRRPARGRSRVDLPLPLGPRRTRASPGSRRKDSASNTRLPRQQARSSAAKRCPTRGRQRRSSMTWPPFGKVIGATNSTVARPVEPQGLRRAWPQGQAACRRPRGGDASRRAHRPAAPPAGAFATRRSGAACRPAGADRRPAADLRRLVRRPSQPRPACSCARKGFARQDPERSPVAKRISG